MARYKLTIAYDGTDFCGWQKQSPLEEGAPVGLRLGVDESASGDREVGEQKSEGVRTSLAGIAEPGLARVDLRTVQAVVERAVRVVVREPVVVMGASRTDSGVHARGQVAAFTCSSEPERGIGWPVERGTEGLVKAINSRLPPDVLVMGAEVASGDFNPIQGATSKLYSYTIWNGPTRPLWERRTALHVWRALDVGAMAEAAKLIEGEHDFAAFAAAGHGRLSTVRTVFSCRVREEMVNGGAGASPGVGEGESARAGLARAPDAQVSTLPGLAPGPPLGQDAERRIVIEVCGSGFLWNMVRIIAGTLVEVGKGRMPLERIGEALRAGKRELAGPTLQPQGLRLEWIKYE